MGNQPPTFGVEYLERKRRELIHLRDQLRVATDAAGAEAANVKLGSDFASHEDDAQRLDTLEKAGKIVGGYVDRINRVERALKKLDEGTYGYSDMSDARIPDDRLEAMPEAICTAAEQERIERRG